MHPHNDPSRLWGTQPKPIEHDFFGRDYLNDTVLADSLLFLLPWYTHIYMGLEAHSNAEPTLKEAPVEDLKQMLQAILSKPLSPENIGTYFDETLEQVVELVDKACARYHALHPDITIPTIILSGAELEDAAFAHFGLSSIPETLDLISKKSETLRMATEYLGTAVHTVPEVILPPSAQGHERGPSTRDSDLDSSEEVVASRLQTLVYILADQGVKLDEVHVEQGVLTDEMRRRVSYAVVKIPELDRTVFVCDASRNATFMLDTSVLDRTGIDFASLAGISKDALNALFDAWPGLGVRITYSPTWTTRVRGYLNEDILSEVTHSIKSEDLSDCPPLAVSAGEADEWRGFALGPDGKHYATPGVLAAKLRRTNSLYRTLARMEGLDSRQIVTASGRIRPGYSFEQIAELLSDKIRELPNGEASGEWAKFYYDGECHFGSISAIEIKMGVDRARIESAVLDLKLDHIEIRVGGNVLLAYPYEEILAKLQRMLSLEGVASTGEWRGFLTKDSSGHGTEVEGPKHYGPLFALSERLRLSKTVLTTLVKDLPSINVRGLARTEEKAYDLELVRPLAENYRALPSVQTEGDWKGFIFIEGAYYGTIIDLKRKLNRYDESINRFVASGKLASIDGKDSTGRVRRFYSYSSVEKLLPNIP